MHLESTFYAGRGLAGEMHLERNNGNNSNNNNSILLLLTPPSGHLHCRGSRHNNNKNKNNNNNNNNDLQCKGILLLATCQCRGSRLASTASLRLLFLTRGINNNNSNNNNNILLQMLSAEGRNLQA
ncbi:unnamed protein product [Polarella glacialis]|uniref:Uncharacterized protein n=1 Tax=Polarella glacialis TaxID=89957 RepID=A0A813ETS8_POLGL|nr:unnamed protein product [Polarella glacialis]